jgi:hypothetical protein
LLSGCSNAVVFDFKREIAACHLLLSTTLTTWLNARPDFDQSGRSFSDDLQSGGGGNSKPSLGSRLPGWHHNTCSQHHLCVARQVLSINHLRRTL